MQDLIAVKMDEPVGCNLACQLHLVFEQGSPSVDPVKRKSQVPNEPLAKLGTMSNLASRVCGSIIDDRKSYAVCGQMAQAVAEVWLFVPGGYDCNDFHAQ